MKTAAENFNLSRYLPDARVARVHLLFWRNLSRQRKSTFNFRLSVLHHFFKDAIDQLIVDVTAAVKSGGAKVWAVKLNSPVQRVRFISKMIQTSEASGLAVREALLASRQTIFQQLEREMSKTAIDAVIVNGFDTSAKDAPTEDKVCQMLESFAKSSLGLPVSVVFCLPTFLLDLAYRKAPNFWRLVSSHIIDFKTEIDIPKELDYDAMPSVPETTETRQKRIELLESQLAEIRQRFNAAPSDQIPTLLILAQIYFDDRQYEKSYEVYGEALLQLVGANSPLNRAKVLHQVGVILHIWGYYEKAAQHYRDSLAIRTQQGDMEGVAATLHQLGLLYQDLGEFDKAIDFYARSIVQNKTLNSDAVSASTLLHLGTLYEETGLQAKAVEQYREAFELYRRKGNYRGMAISLLYTGRVYEERHLYRESVKYFYTAFSIFNKLNLPYKDIAAQSLTEIEATVGKSEFEKFVKESKKFSPKNDLPEPSES